METKYTDKHPIDLTTEVLATFPNGGKVVVYNAIDRTTEDFRRILSCAKFFAQQGKQVVMPPKLNVPYKNPAYDMIFGSLRGTQYYGKCPDLQVDGVWYEHEGFSGEKPKRSFRNMCYHGLRQCDRLILENCGLTFGFMYRSLLGRIERGEKIKEVWIHSENDMHLLLKQNSRAYALPPESTNPQNRQSSIHPTPPQKYTFFNIRILFDNYFFSESLCLFT